MSRDQITKMLDGLDGVTHGAWIAKHGQVFSYQEKGEFAHITPVTGEGRMTDLDAAHIARCDPDTIRALCELALRGLDERMCVNCGKHVPASHPRHEPLPECVDPETGLSACTFDHTPDEAWQHWSQKAHALRAENERLRTDLADTLRVALTSSGTHLLAAKISRRYRKTAPELADKIDDYLWQHAVGKSPFLRAEQERKPE